MVIVGAAIALSAKAKAAALSPRPILVTARFQKKTKIIRLVFKQRFQLSARLLPGFLSGGMIACNRLRPA
jgi:hypothetical protein